MSMNNNPTRNNDVSSKKTTKIRIAMALITAISIGLIGYVFYVSGDIPATKPINKTENNSLTAPTSDYPYDKNEGLDANDRNLSSQPSQNLDSNNKPFDGNDKDISSSPTKPN